jgi:uncharacterized protein
MLTGVRFEWDTVKAELNRRNHGVSFETAIKVFADPMHVSEMDRIMDGEQRWQSIGLVGGVRLILVAHTWRDQADGTEVIRIISARKAEAHERKRYEQ